MNLAYIILAHKFPKQLNRLIARLNDKGTSFVIHLCKNTSRTDFEKINNLLGKQKNVFFCKREDGSWGEFGIVQAVLNSMCLLQQKKIEFDYVNVISGNDYPIKSNESIRNFFLKTKGTQFLWYLPVYDYKPGAIPEGKIYGEGWKDTLHPWNNRFLRIEKYWYSLLGERLMIIPETRFLDKPLWNVIKIFLYNAPDYYKIQRLNREFLLMLFSLTHKEKRQYPKGYIPYAGSQWFSITKDCCEYILNIHKKNPELKRYFKRTLLPDETFFTTILVHSHYKENIAQSNLRFIRWDGEDRSHPVTLTKADLPALKRSEKLFARKFDPEVDGNVLDLIDREILKL